MDITNTGSRSGSETVQVYAHDVEAKVDRPFKELIGFEKIHLDPNETKTVKIEIKGKDLAYYDVNIHDWNLDPGTIQILVGSSSQDIHLKSEIVYS